MPLSSLHFSLTGVRGNWANSRDMLSFIDPLVERRRGGSEGEGDVEGGGGKAIEGNHQFLREMEPGSAFFPKGRALGLCLMTYPSCC